MIHYDPDDLIFSSTVQNPNVLILYQLLFPTFFLKARNG